MRDKIRNFLLYISAFVPLYFLVFVKLVVDIINDNLRFNVLNTLMFCGLIALIVMGVVGVLSCINQDDEKKVEINIISTTNTTDQYFLGYFSLFVLFALSFDLSMVSMTCVFIMVLIFIGVVYMKNNLYYINPLLNIMGYSCYDVVYNINGNYDKVCGKIYFKGKLEAGKAYEIGIKNKNFSFATDIKKEL